MFCLRVDLQIASTSFFNFHLGFSCSRPRQVTRFDSWLDLGLVLTLEEIKLPIIFISIQYRFGLDFVCVYFAVFQIQKYFERKY